MSRAIMQQALDALNTCDWDYDGDENPYKTFDEDLVNEAAAALQEALAEPEQVTAPPRKPWVGLTEEEIATIFFNFANKGVVELTRVIEANFKRKNGAT